jgi:hypothetical protein
VVANQRPSSVRSPIEYAMISSASGAVKKVADWAVVAPDCLGCCAPAKVSASERAMADTAGATRARRRMVNPRIEKPAVTPPSTLGGRSLQFWVPKHYSLDLNES